MDIESVARKLEPLLPQDVRHWRHTRDLVDADLRSLLDKKLLSLARERLGDTEAKCLLSLPPKRTAFAPLKLGTLLYESAKWHVGLHEYELLQNVAIFGRSGSGKTNVAFHILLQLSDKRIPFLFFDWKRTARHLLPLLRSKVSVFTPGRSLAPLSFNPFIPPPGLERGIYLNLLIDVLSAAYTLGDGARSILHRAISARYRPKAWPTVASALKAVETLPTKEREGGWKLSALRALRSLDAALPAAGENVNQTDLVSTLIENSTIIELDGLNDSAKKFLLPMLALWIYYLQLGSGEREKLKLVLVIEEAHHVLYRQEHRSKESVMNMLLRQCREIGIGIIVVDQHPHLISAAALGNTFTTLCLNQKDPSDINRAAGLCLLPETEKRWLSMLPVGQGIVKLQDRWHRPFLVQFPLVPVRKGAVTDAALRGIVAGRMTGSALRKLVLPKKGQVRQGRVSESLSDDELAFIIDVFQQRDDGVKARYRRLGWSVDKGNRMKGQLLDRGLLDSEIIPIGRTRKTLLRLSSEGSRLFNAEQAEQVSAESLAHEYWKRRYADLYRGQSYLVEIEAPRPDAAGRVDVLARRDHETVAIEIETGKSDVVQNVRQDLRAGFTRVLVVATNKASLDRVERQLAAAGLLIPGRLGIELATGRNAASPL